MNTFHPTQQFLQSTKVQVWTFVNQSNNESTLKWLFGVVLALFLAFIPIKFVQYKKYEPWVGEWVDSRNDLRVSIELGMFWGLKIKEIKEEEGGSNGDISIHDYRHLEKDGKNVLEIEGTGFKNHKFTWEFKMPENRKLECYWVVHSSKFPDSEKDGTTEFKKVLWSQKKASHSSVLLSKF